jgi:WD40 repeat protein
LTDPVPGVRFARRVAAPVADGLRAWDPKTGRESSLDLPEPPSLGWAVVTACSPDARLVAVASADGGIWLWDRRQRRLVGRRFLNPGAEALALTAEKARQLVPSRIHYPQESAGLAFSPDNRLLAVIERDGSLSLRAVSGWEQRRGLPAAARRFVAFSPDGKLLATNDGGQVQLRDARTLALVASREEPGRGTILCGCFSPDGHSLAVGTEDKAVKLWDHDTGDLRELRGHQERVSAVAFAPDGRTVASGGWDRTVRLWSVAAGHEVATFEAHAGKVHAVTFSPDGRVLASGGETWSGQGDENSAVGEVFFWRAEAPASR